MRIKKLPENIVNKIAAGEVVERPASVLKELIENSIDAQAARIVISVEKGGKRLVEVKDNGTGIHPDDILEAVGRFSTSKINSFDDLFFISSYGFRGEALASISAVSRFSLISRQREFSLGKELYIEGGVFKHLSDTGAPVGTTVRVRDLFFNLPARKKFLKSERTELSHIIDVFHRYALYHSEIHFELYIDQKKSLILQPETVEDRIKRLYPKVENLVYFEKEAPEGRVSGYYSPDYQTEKGFIFINGRPIKNAVLKKVIRSLLGNNFYVVFLELPPYMVDFNVHPAKIEVKFRKEAPVYRLLKEAVNRSEKPVFHLSQPKNSYSAEFKVLGQIENTFIVVYYNGDVYFIDQHIASERINYELLLKKYRTSGLDKKQIKPVKMTVDSLQKEKLKELKELLEKAGFTVNEENSTIIITTVPEGAEERDIRKFIYSLLDSETPQFEIESFLGEIACELSVEAGDILHEEEAKSLLKIWLETENPNLCPHGRPIYYKLPLELIKKKVGRK
ncbi:DNA mismatch repair endonuclease MutL [Persephonella sp.]